MVEKCIAIINFQEVLQIYYCAFCGDEYDNKVNLHVSMNTIPTFLLHNYYLCLMSLSTGIQMLPQSKATSTDMLESHHLLSLQERLM